MTEYNFKGTYEHGSLDEVVGEIDCNSKLDKLGGDLYVTIAGMGLGLIAAGFMGTILYSIEMTKNYLLR